MRSLFIQFLLSLLLLPRRVLAEPAYLINADWLSEHIEDENLLILGIRHHPHRYFTVGIYPGLARFANG